MKILITGGAGFIGTHACRAFVGAGWEVSVLDIADPRERVPEVRYRLGDIRNPEDLKVAMRGASHVLHLAAIVGIPACQKDVEGGYSTNLWGTLQVLQQAREVDARIMFASSATVYGHLGKLGESVSESFALGDPLSFYGAQKLGGEHMLRLAHESWGAGVMVFRFFNVYGVGQPSDSPYSGVITAFARQIHEGTALVLHGGGVQTRDFVSVKDLCRAFLLAVGAKSWEGLPINLGCGESISVRGLADLMMEVSGRRVDMSDGPRREGDVLHSQADCSRAKELLGWVPKVVLREGLLEVIQQKIN